MPYIEKVYPTQDDKGNWYEIRFPVWVDPNPPTFTITTTPEYIQPCAFDNLPEDCKGKPMWLYCSCPKCSPYC